MTFEYAFPCKSLIRYSSNCIAMTRRSNNPVEVTSIPKSVSLTRPSSCKGLSNSSSMAKCVEKSIPYLLSISPNRTLPWHMIAEITPRLRRSSELRPSPRHTGNLPSSIAACQSRMSLRFWTKLFPTLPGQNYFPLYR